MKNDEEFDVEAFLKEIGADEPISDELINDIHNFAKELDKINDYYDNKILSENDKKIDNIINTIDKEKKLETEFVKNLSDEEKLKYLQNNNKMVEQFYKENHIETVGKNISDDDI